MAASIDHRRTVWVVDDSPTDLERVRRLLSTEYRLEIFSDAAVALERLTSSQLPDLLLLDWVMPGMTGLEVCQFVRAASGKIAQLPIILLTAHHGSQEIVQAFRSGANDYVSKPFVDEELKARVEILLGTKRLVERAERAETDLRTLLSTAPDPIFAVDAQGEVTFVNEEGRQALGLNVEEILGKPFRDLIPGVGLSVISIGPGESFLPAADVQIGDKVFSPSIRILPSDSASMTTVALRDVTSRRQSEARRLDFYSIIAHDLRTPITAVLLRLQMAFRGRHGVLPAGLLTDLRRSETNLRALVGMINDFLELAKLEGVGYKIDRTPIDIGTLIKTTVDDFEPLFQKNMLTTKFQGLEKPHFVLGDGQRLTQVFSNLIGNAIKFTPTSGQITTTVSNTEDHVEVAISDTGRGIAAQDIPSLFERFTRAGENINPTPGTGLGLMIVREIIEAHGGVIGVESELGVGSKFWFRLPRFHQNESSATA